MSAISSGGVSDQDNKKARDMRSPSTSESEVTQLWRAHDGGCDVCSHTGYKGRMGIYEALENTKKKKKKTNSRERKQLKLLRHKQLKKVYLTMQMDGLIKALRGQTSIEEILRD